ncbi:MAG: helicase related protein [Bryobacterales bacterium]|nr:helicase related protein [Bryobacterales bacterium]
MGEGSSQGTRDAQARVLEFWRAVELLSPQKIPKEDPSSRDYPVIQVDPGKPLPWCLPDWGQPLREGKAWRFVLYGGSFQLAALRLLLVRKFGRDADSFDRRQGGASCLFAVQLAADGRPLFDSLTVASCPWALSQTVSPGPHDRNWLEGFGKWRDAQKAQLERLWGVPEEDEQGLKLLARYRVGRRLQHSDISQGVRLIASNLRAPRNLHPGASLLAASVVPQDRTFEPAGFDFVNSFFAEDLALVGAAVKAGNAGAALSLVLVQPEQLNEGARVDVRQSRETLWSGLAPERFPRGRWPAPISQSPYFSQQFAINSATAMLDDSEGGVIGVNGPPGTGKTTLLRELVASVIVKRAQALAALRRPIDAFEGEVVWKSDRYTRTVSLWKPEFRGFEMVVASNNNRAVENVTLEIPSAAAISPEWLAAVDYFADFATRLQRKTKGAGEAWALVAARFGNKKNRKLFRDNFWYKDDEVEQPQSRAERGFAEYLRSVKAKPSSWKSAVRSFEAALEAEGRIRSTRTDAWATTNALTEACDKLSVLQKRVRDCDVSLDAADERLVVMQNGRARAAENRDHAVAARKQHQSFKPALVDAIFTMGSAYREWRADDERYAARVADAEAEYRRAAASLDDAEQERRRAVANQAFALSELALMQDTVRAEQDKLRLLSERLGSSFPNPADWSEDSEARELSSPWSDEEWNRARTSVFLEALHLHRAFIECSSLRFRQNLWAGMDLLSGKIPSGVDQRSAESTWATMFFVLPVISTTFASFDRLFAHLGRESLGWLLMDEAGQTTPQASAGAIWRSKRVVATGDPLQLEPIVSLPYTSQQALRKHFGVDEIWMPSQNSAQWLVDRASSYGTYLHFKAEPAPAWVGCPLRVHRRCEQPMFDISNHVAYGGQMVYATPEQPPINLSPSRWLHVASDQAEGHWIPDEGILLNVLLLDLFASGMRPDAVLLISPFRAVALKLRQIAKKFGIRRVGTIHIAQGAESEVVILVLGSNPASEAARDWASERPNLLNVAVSRAKRRLYIIGNRDLWGRLPHFSEAAEQLTAGSRGACV